MSSDEQSNLGAGRDGESSILEQKDVIEERISSRLQTVMIQQ
jgi:hypothetical protein